MFGHACDEPIVSICPHPWNNQVALCTTKTVVLIDLFKNRSVRSSNFASLQAKGTQIGLFFVDNISCRSYQSILKSTFQELPADYFLCVTFTRGVILFDSTMNSSEWIPFDFTATCVAQAPDALIIGDNTNSLMLFSLMSLQVKKLTNTQAVPGSIFVTQFAGDQYGILSIGRDNGAMDFFAASGKLAAQSSGESSKSISFDVYTSTLFVLCDRRKVNIYSVSPSKIEKTGECSFSGVAIGDSRPTNYSAQQISPCRLPLSPKPLFYAICDQCTLLIGGSTKVVQKVSAFPAVKISKKLNCSMMIHHPTDMSLLLFAAENQFFVLDMWAHLPTIVPSLGIPDFIPSADRFDGIYLVRRNDQIICLLNHSTESYSLYDAKTTNKIITRNAIDVAVGPNRRYAELKMKKSRKNKESKEKKVTVSIEVFDDSTSVKLIKFDTAQELQNPMRLVSFGDYFALIVSKNILDLSSNMQQQGKTAALVYKWSTQEPLALQLDGAGMIAYEPPYIALASPNGYAVYNAENNMELIIKREKRVLHFTFFENKLYLLTIDGLEIDNFKTVELVSSRFSHLITKEKNAAPIPMNAVMIKEVCPGSVTLLDISGNATSVGIPEEEIDMNDVPLIVKVANAEDHLKAASEAYKIGSPFELKSLMLMMLTTVGWEKAFEVLSFSERAFVDPENPEFQQEFHEFLMNELEVEK